jgi:hypothetical protein
VGRFYLKSPKRCALIYKQDGVLDENRAMDNVQKHNVVLMYHRHKLLHRIHRLVANKCV